MAKSGRRRLVAGLSCHLLALVSLLAMVPLGHSNETANGIAQRSLLKIEGGWSEVKSGWPIADSDYFIATEKGHHFVETQHLPKGLKHDLKVTFEFYYSYSRTKPVLQMVPCRQNIYLVDERSEDESNKWIKHVYNVNHLDCNQRNQLAYNVLLHDPGDVFAWRLLKIESVKMEEEFTTTFPHEDDETALEKTTEDELLLAAEANSASSLPPSTTTTSPPSTTTTSPPSTTNASPSSTTNASLSSTTTTSPPSTTTTSPPSTTNASPPSTTTTSPPSTTNASPSSTTTTSPPSTTNASPSSTTTTSPSLSQAQSRVTGENKKSESTKTSESKGDDNDPAVAKLQRPRRKRWLDTTNDATPFIATQCKPSSCNRDFFHMGRFSSLIEGVPKLPDSAGEQQQIQKKYYINLKNQPLKLRLESHDEPLTEVDSCVKFDLYMDANTELELLLEKPKVKNNDQQVARGTVQTQAEPVLEQLELIKRRESDSTAGKWDEFQRCISDYVPAYRLPKGASKKDADSLTFVLRPRGKQRAGQMAILVRPNESGYLAHLYPTQPFLPDIKQVAFLKDLGRYWVLDRDGLNKPKLNFIYPNKAYSYNMDKALRVSQIDVTQEYFELTSRWLKIDGAETLEQPILFTYYADQVDWIEQIDLQYQEADDQPNVWNSQMFYKAPTSRPSATTTTTTTRKSGDSALRTTEKQVADTDKDNATAVAHQQVQKPPKLIELPIRLKRLDSSEFRLRLKHYIKAPQQGVPSTSAKQPYDLIIRSLAFADACSYGRAYCQNQAVCRPTGAAQAECICVQGYSGKRCEHFHPCEALYGSPATRTGQLTGHEVCRSMGARCIDQLPVMRCEWPNDLFYQCKRLYKLDPESGRYLPIGRDNSIGDGANSSRGAGGTAAQTEDDPEPLGPEGGAVNLKETVERQAKLVIILIVFIVAILIFAFVLLGSMVGRLRESSRRLRKSQGEVHELARRMHPSGFNGGGPVSGGRQAMTPKAGTSSVVGYNNSAFDVDS